jgi:uncharacterized protein
MKVVVDTNVFVSSIYGGTPQKVVGLWRNGACDLCLSQPVLSEYIAVLNRLFPHSDRISELLFLFRIGYHTQFTSTTPTLQIVRDPKDDKFIECAVALGANVVVSGDADLCSLKEYAGIKIMRPAEFIKQFDQTPDLSSGNSLREPVIMAYGKKKNKTSGKSAGATRRA